MGAAQASRTQRQSQRVFPKEGYTQAASFQWWLEVTEKKRLRRHGEARDQESLQGKSSGTH